MTVAISTRIADSISEFNFISTLGHFFMYSLRKPKISFERSMLIVSTDIDVGSPELGIVNKGKRDRDVNIRLSEYQVGRIEEISIPLFVKVFDYFEMPITFAVRGQLTEIDAQVLEVILASCVKHDIGAHGYYHRKFTQLTDNEAEDELRLTSAGMEKIRCNPKTFIFPRNCVAHLNLLEKYKYVCYRSSGGLVNDRMQVEKSGQLYNIHPSIYIDQHSSLLLLRKILDVSIQSRSPFHVWFHLWNFGEEERSISKTIRNLFIPFLQYAKEKQENELLEFETMLSAAQKVRSLSDLQ